jgi:ketosteroid isomerase-like protein
MRVEMAVEGGVTVETLKQLLDAFNQHDLDRIMDFFSEDATFDLPRGTEAWRTRYIGKAAVRNGLATRFTGGYRSSGSTGEPAL